MLRVPVGLVETKYLMNYRRPRNSDTLMVEDNLVNRIVLGREFRCIKDDQQSKMKLDAEGLFEYQCRDIQKAMSLKHHLNANPMGLGKTPETIRLLKTVGASTALIVVPKILRTQWQSQLKLWGNYDAEIYEKQSVVSPGVWIINYEKLRNETTRSLFKRFQWQYLIVDEAHRIKNRNSAQTLAIKDIPALHRVALTGTPILRYVDDLWSILNFLDPFYSGKSYWNFVQYFCEQQKTPWGNKIIGLSKDPTKIAILNMLLDIVSIRNEVEVAEGKYIEVVKLPMEKSQRELYRKEKQLLLDELPENLTIANGAVLALRLMQTTSWPGQFIEGLHGPKFEWILEQCLDNPNENFVVFSVFATTVNALVDYLNSNSIKAVSITGKNKASVNDQNKQSFVSGQARVLAGTIDAMGQGYDGLQQASHIAIFIDRDWSPEIMVQAEDRLHRMGQQSLVSVYYLECTGSFDQHVGRVNKNKAEDIVEALKKEE